eukprot:SAG31_NODE_542_length_14269_cov_7.826253_13_plen_65_part_00
MRGGRARPRHVPRAHTRPALAIAIIAAIYIKFSKIASRQIAWDRLVAGVIDSDAESGFDFFEKQ